MEKKIMISEAPVTLGGFEIFVHRVKIIIKLKY